MILTHLDLARQLAATFSRLPQVEAIALSGSLGTGSTTADSASDIDLYVYTRDEIPLSERQTIMEAAGGATQANIGLNYWGSGDEWYHLPSGIEVDVVYFSKDWMSSQIDRVVSQHRASMGYTTCFWFTLMQSILLYDPHGWLEDLQEKCNVPYPDELRSAIVQLNHPLLRGIIPAYAHQLEKAVKRSDLVSVNHRLAALLASYFDIIFAVNRQLHPGEKRLIQQALQRCSSLPIKMEADLNALFTISSKNLSKLPSTLDRLLTHLDEWLVNQGFLPNNKYVK
jgi:hypothetical protein